MPDGLIVMRYDDRSGIDIKVKFPEEEVNVSDKTCIYLIYMNSVKIQES